jgi:UDP-N-acetylmuramate dehydrogenase
MLWQENVSLKPYTTFGVAASARFFASFHSIPELQESVYAFKGKRMVLGGGSNVLFTADFDGLVLRNEIEGIELVGEDEEYFYVKAGGGVNWHQFVLHCIANGYSGVENLSLIPGSVGASPMQNIGAYGVEIKDVFLQLEAWHLEDHRMDTFSHSDCGFGYRESVFKNKYKGRYVIISVTYRLRKIPEYHTEYGAIRQELDAMAVEELSISAISQAVINIRSSKLPDWRETGNAGSFFKNPQVAMEEYERLKDSFPSIVAYPQQDGMKLAAGWLIEQCGWKGFRRGDAGCYPKQALVLVNYGNASGNEIFALSEEIIASVQSKFGVSLEREVNIIRP